ncbi:hypothetical protein BVY03_03220 [bacterium K02(2017)]|nr:hypothetical protein BVY03_03220 [bacterium K02(2017)]
MRNSNCKSNYIYCHPNLKSYFSYLFCFMLIITQLGCIDSAIDDAKTELKDNLIEEINQQFNENTTDIKELISVLNQKMDSIQQFSDENFNGISAELKEEIDSNLLNLSEYIEKVDGLESGQAINTILNDISSAINNNESIDAIIGLLLSGMENIDVIININIETEITINNFGSENTDAVSVSGENTNQPTEIAPNVDENPNQLGNVVDIALRATGFCVLLEDGAVKCGDILNNVPKNIHLVNGFGSAVTKITSSGLHTCALLENQTVKCWGSNSDGQLGLFAGDKSDTPVLIQGLNSPVIDVAAEFQDTCAILQNGQIKCWGKDYASLPVTIEPVQGVSEFITTGYDYKEGCATKNDGSAQCWGLTGRSVNLSHLEVDALSLGISHYCALLTSGNAKCWGINSFGNLGDGTFDSHFDVNNPNGEKYPLVDVIGLNGQAVEIKSGYKHNCTLLENGGMKCWGSNQYNQLGNNTFINENIPVSVIGLTDDIVSYDIHGDSTCVAYKNGGIKCWGKFEFTL